MWYMKNTRLSQTKERDKFKDADSQKGTSHTEITKFIASASLPVHSLH